MLTVVNDHQKSPVGYITNWITKYIGHVRVHYSKVNYIIIFVCIQRGKIKSTLSQTEI